MKKKRYVIWNSENRWGEFEFCCSTQANYCTSPKRAREEIKGLPADEPQDLKKFRIYEITLKAVRR